jgi:hypothetical protein
MFAHHEPSFHQSTLSARLVPVGVDVPLNEKSLCPMSPVAAAGADPSPNTSARQIAHQDARVNAPWHAGVEVPAND